jgi:hypothetical protein
LAIGLFGWEIFQWLRDCHWQNYAIADALVFFQLDPSAILRAFSRWGMTRAGEWVLKLPL